MSPSMKYRAYKIKQVFKKLKILCLFIIQDFKEWKSSVWEKDLNELSCCNGKDCYCSGGTIEDMYLPKDKQY